MHNQTKVGHIALVGAGPGDPELITLKGIQALEKATVILMDALLSPDLVNRNPIARKIFVGKRKGNHALEQAEINTLMVGLALQGERVVRLKGGDPMIFGRAAEELNSARQFGIPIEVIPGISAYSGIAAAFQFPITHRGLAESLWVTTGFTHDGSISADFELAARSSATVVVYMGFSRLAEIVETLRLYKPANYPAAVIQNGTLPNERSTFGTLADIVERVNATGIGTPALLLFGPAVSMLSP